MVVNVSTASPARDPARQKLAVSDQNLIFLPFVANNICPACDNVPSPFSLQISALHQITVSASSTGNRITSVMSEAEWRAMYDAAFPTLVTALKNSGAGWTRVYIKWSDIEPTAPVAGQPPQYTWSWYDPKLSLIAATGVQMILTIADVPTWAAASPCAPIYADQLGEFARFLGDLVNRYKQPPYNVSHWEIINEPDYTWDNGYLGGLGCWGNYGAEYAQMLARADPAIKAADPQSKMLMGGVAYDWFTEYGGPFYRYFPDQVMGAGGGKYLDILNFHYFPDFHAEWERWTVGNRPTCGIVDDGLGLSYAVQGIDLIAKTTFFRNRMHTCFGQDQPIWITELAEHGYANDPNSLAQQARYVVQGYARGLAAGVQNITWYALTTPNDSYEQGLLYDDWTPKPAFYAYQTMTTELKGFTYARTLNIAGGEGYVFRSPLPQEKTIAWGSGLLLLAPANQVRVVSLSGAATTIADGSADDKDGRRNGQIQVQLTADPVFIQVLN